MNYEALLWWWRVMMDGEVIGIRDDVVCSWTIRAGVVVSTGSLEYKDRCERRSRGRALSSAIARGRRTARAGRGRRWIGVYCARRAARSEKRRESVTR